MITDNNYALHLGKLKGISTIGTNLSIHLKVGESFEDALLHLYGRRLFARAMPFCAELWASIAGVLWYRKMLFYINGNYVGDSPYNKFHVARRLAWSVIERLTGDWLPGDRFTNVHVNAGVVHPDIETDLKELGWYWDKAGAYV
jgi:hypothetical protein